ncbi:hypothetical protein HDU76_000522 [Blyttiomyces sp. JEL0837]|nr:hypothetical protein HDU76_000522 [Blyttiomyces sp. JEL0837]
MQLLVPIFRRVLFTGRESKNFTEGKQRSIDLPITYSQPSKNSEGLLPGLLTLECNSKNKDISHAKQFDLETFDSQSFDNNIPKSTINDNKTENSKILFDSPIPPSTLHRHQDSTTTLVSLPTSTNTSTESTAVNKMINTTNVDNSTFEDDTLSLADTLYRDSHMDQPETEIDTDDINLITSSSTSSSANDDPIIAKMLSQRTAMTDVPEDAEAERRKRMYIMLRWSHHYKKMQVQNANEKWSNPATDCESGNTSLADFDSDDLVEEDVVCSLPTSRKNSFDLSLMKSTLSKLDITELPTPTAETEKNSSATTVPKKPTTRRATVSGGSPATHELNQPQQTTATKKSRPRRVSFSNNVTHIDSEGQLPPLPPFIEETTPIRKLTRLTSVNESCDDFDAQKLETVSSTSRISGPRRLKTLLSWSGR